MEDGLRNVRNADAVRFGGHVAESGIRPGFTEHGGRGVPGTAGRVAGG